MSISLRMAESSRSNLFQAEQIAEARQYLKAHHNEAVLESLENALNPELAGWHRKENASIVSKVTRGVIMLSGAPSLVGHTHRRNNLTVVS